MKRKIIIVLIVLVVALGGTCTWAALNANRLLEEHRAELEALASKSLSASVSIGKIETSFFPSTRLIVSKLGVARSKKATSSLTLDNLALHVNLFALLGGKVDVSTLSLDSPSITVLKTATGFEIEGLPPAKKARKAAQGKSGKAALSMEKHKKNAKTAPALPGWLKLDLDGFQIRNANITVKGLIKDRDFALSRINVDAGLKLRENTAVLPELSITAVAPGSTEVLLEGKGLEFDLQTQKVSIANLRLVPGRGSISVAGNADLSIPAASLSTSSDGVQLAALQGFIQEIAPTLPVTDLEGAVAPQLAIESSKPGAYSAAGNVALQNIGLKSAGLKLGSLEGALAVKASEKEQIIQSEKLSLMLGNQPITLSLDILATKLQAEIRKLHIDAFGGTIDATGSIAHPRPEKSLSTKLTAADLDINSAVQALKPALADVIAGTLAEFKATVHGKPGTEKVPHTFRGSGNVEVKDGELKQINLAGEVLRSVKDLPFIKDALYARVPEGQRKYLDSNATAIRSLTAKWKLGSGRIQTSNLRLVSDIFELQARGGATIDFDVDLDAKILFNPDFSATLVSATKELKHLLDKQDRLVFPLTIKGTAPKLLVYPDLTEIGKVAAKHALKDKAADALGKALGGGESLGKSIGDLLDF